MIQHSLVIIPCYNEGKRLPKNQFCEYLIRKPPVNLLFVNDGSTDNTLEVLEQLENRFKAETSILNLTVNVGKAEAIRQGVLHSINKNFNYIGYFDADLATPLNEIERLVNFTNSSISPYLIMGSRVKLLGSTEITRKIGRHYIGRVFATIVSNMLKLPIYDTQCGAKLIKADIAKVIFSEKFVSKWLFDVELLFRIKKNFNNLEGKIIEIPLKKWDDVAGSKIGIMYFLKAPFDLLKIYFKYN